MKIVFERSLTLIILAAYIAVSIRNTSNRAMYVSDSNGKVEPDYVIDERDSQGRPASDTDFGLKLKSKEQGYFSSETVFTLQPGDSHKTVLVVTKL